MGMKKNIKKAGRGNLPVNRYLENRCKTGDKKAQQARGDDIAQGNAAQLVKGVFFNAPEKIFQHQKEGKICHHEPD